MRYFFHIGYHGYAYRGWQRQPKLPNIQQVLETTLSTILKTPTSIMGCGRTDAQVHASQYFFHADIQHSWDYDLLFRINKALPADISVFEIIPVEENHHARFDVSQRTYSYYIHTYKDPFLSTLSSFYDIRNLDIDSMRQAVALLPNYSDFRAFCKAPNTYDHTLCLVSDAYLLVDEQGDRLKFQISANRFLGRMIRLLVGKLIRIGKKELSVDEFEQYLITKEPPKTFHVAYPQGLYLSKVTYPYLDIPMRSDFLQGFIPLWAD